MIKEQTRRKHDTNIRMDTLNRKILLQVIILLENEIATKHVI